MKRTNVYQMVTDRIIAQLKEGVVPWKKPWTNAIHRECFGAYNRVTKKSYSFINQMLLKHEGEYATFKQWQDLGGHIKRGEKSEIIVFFKLLETKKEPKEEENVGENMEGNEKKYIPYLKYINVFHISQVEGVDPLEIPKDDLENLDQEGLEWKNSGDRVVSNYIEREGIRYDSQGYSKSAYYAPAIDKICIPNKDQFESLNEYYSTMFHEMVHSTGHSKRLNRDLKSWRQDHQKYGKEELIAEIGSSFLMNGCQIETEGTSKNSAAYINDWLKTIKEDNRCIVSAAGKAEKAVDYILYGKQEGR